MLRSLALLAVTLCVVPAAAAETLPRPAGLEPNVRFWARIYSEVDGHGGLIHDSEHLDVVYEHIRLAEGLSRRARERQVERAKDKIRGALLTLAKGKRSGLSVHQKHVLSLWPTDVSNATLRAAAGRVRFQLGQADKFRAGLIRAGQWRAYIEEQLREHGVPLELAALPHVESSFNPMAYSRVGAAGMWQFTRSTGRRYLRVDHVVDERMDPFKATVGAARLLRDNHGRLGHWPLAITAYNHGVAGMSRAVRNTGSHDMAVISRRYKSRTFGFASRNFYAEFLAALEVDRNADALFGQLPVQSPTRYDTVELDSYYGAASLADALGVSRELLREHNPALRPSVWNGAKYAPRGYELRVPRGAAQKPLQIALASARRYAEQHRDKYYKVRRGDTLSKIASRYRVSMSKLVAVNNLRSRHRIRVGQVLILPDDAHGTSVQVARQEPPSDGVYRVRRGDNLTIIAARFGVSATALARENGLRNRNVLHVGQRLRLPGHGIQLASAKAPATPEPDAIRVATAEPIHEGPAVSPAEPLAEIAVAEPPAEEPEAAADEPPAPTNQAPQEAPGEPSAEAPAEAPAETPTATVVAAEEPAPEPAEPEAPTVVAAIPPRAAEATAEPAESSGSANGRSTPDPSNYSVSSSQRIVVQAEETLGHYAEWLELRASQLRRLNGMRYGSPVVIGRSIRLDFSRVTPELFEQRRLAYHHDLQEEFFSSYEVTGTTTHVLRPGESLWYLAERKFRLPVWLLRQYNPDLDFAELPAGARMVIPEVEPRSADQT